MKNNRNGHNGNNGPDATYDAHIVNTVDTAHAMPIDRIDENETNSSIFDYIYPFYKGVLDGINIYSTSKLIYRSSRIKKFLYKVLPLYSIFAIVNLIYYKWFYISILPTKTWVVRVITSSLWWIIWLIPAYALTKILYYKQFSELWKIVYKNQKKQKKQKTNGWKYTSELIYGTTLSLAYSMQTLFIELFIPIKILASIFSIISFSWAISWTVFENRFIYQGFDLSDRIHYFERRWLYFLGFGLPLAIIYRYVDWVTGISLWYFASIILSLRVILANPIKTPKYDKSSNSNKSSI